MDTALADKSVGFLPLLCRSYIKLQGDNKMEYIEDPEEFIEDEEYLDDEELKRTLKMKNVIHRHVQNPKRYR